METRNKSDEISSVSIFQRIIAVVVIIIACNYGRDYLLKRHVDGSEVFASASEYINERSVEVACSKDYNAEYEGCIPKKCGRFVMDSVINMQEATRVRKLAEKGMAYGGGSENVANTVVDLHSGTLSFGHNSVNIYSMSAKDNKTLFSKDDLEFYKSVKNRIHATVARHFGIDPNLMYLTGPTYTARMTGKPVASTYHEYWHSHIDKMKYDSFDYTSLLYLSNSIEDFSGGRFVFLDKKANATVEPKVGRLSFFSSGSENEHLVERVKEGARFALTFFFTCNKKFAINDPS